MPQNVVWPLPPHTAAKHSILRRYLDAWFPILSSWARRVVFIDGFAGPGEYAGGEPGSPLIAVRAAIEHKQDLSRAELAYLFIEADRRRFAHLNDLLGKMNIPSHIKWQAVNGEFAQVIDTVLNTVEGKSGILAPAFVMVDPFGFSGMPMATLARLAAYPRTELLISFMYESITRWLGQPQLEQNFDDLFGCPQWREAHKITDAEERRGFLLGLYLNQIEEAGMNYVRAFEMIDKGNRTEYYLIFATHSLDGVRAMKAAMWKIDPTGGVHFSDATVSTQLTLFRLDPDFDQLKRQIVRQFAGQHVPVERLEEYVLVETAFRETHFKKQILTPMEKSGELVVESPRRKRYSYPAGIILRFM